tara:strand:- start:13506 stop:13679 length:174 start_codon:yes stop_codon:yes gene_type:complete
MAADNINIKASEIMHSITFRIRVTGLRMAVWRSSIGVAICRLGAWVAGVKIDVSEVE